MRKKISLLRKVPLQTRGQIQSRPYFANIKKRCLIVERNFLIGLDLAESVRFLGFTHVDHALSYEVASALLQKTVYQLAFIDFDEDEAIAQQFASQMRDQGAAIIYTSTLPDRSDLPNILGEYKLLSKPYSVNQLRNMVFGEAAKTAAKLPIASVASVLDRAG